MRKNLLKLESVSGGYERTPVVHEITLSISGGNFAGIIGPNGCGKSTLLRLMTGALTPFFGRVLFDGCDPASIGRKELCRRIACVSQDIAAGFAFNVKDVVLMGRMPYLGRFQNETATDIAIVERALEATDTARLCHKTIDRLSAGERQRVFIAKALAQEPDVLILDEPTSHLDIGHQAAMLDLLLRFNRENGITVVVVLHDLNLAAEYCRQIYLMDKGRITASGDPQTVLTPSRLEAVYRTAVRLRPGIFPVPGS